MTGAVRFRPFNLIYKGEFFEINAPLAKTIDGMNALQPDILIGYGSALGALAEKQLEGLLESIREWLPTAEKRSRHPLVN